MAREHSEGIVAQLSLRGIKKRFRATNVLHGIDLEIGDREFVVFVGPSGCGKSTLLRLIAGLDPISEGEFFLNGHRMNDVAPSRRGIAMVFQSYALYPHMDVYENIAFGARLMGLTKAEVLAQFGGQGFGAFKPALADLAVASMAPVTAEMRRLMNDTTEIDRVLKDGAERAAAIADPVVDEVKKIVGFWRA